MTAISGTLSESESTRLAHCERVIERGRNTFVTVGLALAEIREARLYRATHATFADYVQERWQTSKTHAYRLMHAAACARSLDLSPRGDKIDTSELSEFHLRPLASLPADEQRAALDEAIEASGGILPTPKQLAASAARRKINKNARGCNEDVESVPEPTSGDKNATAVNSVRMALHSSATVEWYTPREYIEAARCVMGAIDLDPASCAEANATVRASRCYTAADDGLSRPWSGRVWLNPPYGRSESGESNQGVWATALIGKYQLGEIDEAVLLVNATTDRLWFRQLWGCALCFAYERIRFIAPGGERCSSPTHGNVFAYVGPNVQAFSDVFGQFGRIVVPHPDTEGVSQSW